MTFIKKNYSNIGFVILGSFIFCLGISVFITPMKLYNGGVLGISEIIRTLLINNGINFKFEVSGIINAILNIPLMILAFRSVSKRFFILTLISIACQSIFFALIPPIQPIMDDTIASVLVGGVIAGFGIGLALRGHGSGGGIDILGVFFSQRFTNFSVGRMGIIVNSFIFTVCAFLFSIKIAIYSVLYTVFYTFIVDRVHYQNIQIEALVFTKHQHVMDFIMQDMHRGVTYWEGKGGYTGEKTYILCTALSKYEMSYFKNNIKKQDRNAFIIFSDSLNITGHFEKRL